MYPNTSAIGRENAIINRARSLMSANFRNTGGDMRNYNRIVQARNNMIRASRSQGLSNG